MRLRRSLALCVLGAKFISSPLKEICGNYRISDSDRRFGLLNYQNRRGRSLAISAILGEAYTPRMSDSYFAAARQRRSRLELKITILKAISQGNQRLAHIMYYSKLPPRLCGSIVRTMEQQGLVEILPAEEGRK